MLHHLTSKVFNIGWISKQVASLPSHVIRCHLHLTQFAAYAQVDGVHLFIHRALHRCLDKALCQI